MTAGRKVGRQSVGVELTIKPTCEQRELMSRHCGARRFAYNWCVGNNHALYKEKKKGLPVKIPVTPFDNINAFNKWKVSAEAGIDKDGKLGLLWRGEVRQSVFEEGAKDFSKALQAAFQNWHDRRNKLMFPRISGQKFTRRGKPLLRSVRT